MMNQLNQTNKNNICNNCGKQGHLFHQCKLPITSYGVILFRPCSPTQKSIKFLMIRRKDSFGYIDFLRGKYVQHNVEHLQNMFNEMSVLEKELIKNNTFATLWKQMWGEMHIGNQYKGEEISSQKKFDSLRNGIPFPPFPPFPPLEKVEPNVLPFFKNTEDFDPLLEKEESLAPPFPKEESLAPPFFKNTEGLAPPLEKVDLDTLINNSTTSWNETEWEFPKGRRNYQEKDLDCALREFEEETGISKKKIKIVENLMPFEEIFIGSNHKSYKHKYFLACMPEYNEKEDLEDKEDNQISLNNYQKSEVSKIQWKTLEDCLESIRPYNLEKKQLIININKVLQEYRLY